VAHPQKNNPLSRLVDNFHVKAEMPHASVASSFPETISMVIFAEVTNNPDAQNWSRVFQKSMIMTCHHVIIQR
jgi:hypothetical protein